MGDRRTNMMLANLASRKQNIQDQVDKKQEDIDKIQDDIDNLNDQIKKIDDDINKLRIKAGLDKESNTEDEFNTTDDQTDMETEEADAAITIGSLDAASDGDYGGWKHYGKIGDTASRFSGKRKKKKNKRDKILSYINKAFDPDSDNDGDYDASDFN